MRAGTGALDYISKPIEAEVLAGYGQRCRRVFLNLPKKAMIDGVTGLWNRQYFEQRMIAEISLSRRSGRPISCLICEVDGFEKITERFGIPGADEVLRTVGQFLVNNCRVEDVNCRFAGEQFGIVAPNTSNEGASDLANRLCATLAHAEFTCRRQQIRITCSMGTADLESAGKQPMIELAVAGSSRQAGRRESAWKFTELRWRLRMRRCFASTPLLLLLIAAAPATNPVHTNHLAQEKSPYLLQHAHNRWTGIRGERRRSRRQRKRTSRFCCRLDIPPATGVT
jgi:diguanylate cyclase (GGDEF)-like protein